MEEAILKKGVNISRLSCVAAENNIFVAANYASVVKGMLNKKVFFTYYS